MNQADDNRTDGSTFRPRRMGHFNFWVHDVHSVAPFYRDVAGLEEVYQRTAIKGIFLSNGNTYHDSAIFDLETPAGHGQTPGLHHFGLELETEVEMCEDHQQVKAQGFEFDYYRSSDVAHSIYGRDAEGNRFEVYADVKANWREERSGIIDQPELNPVWAPGLTEPLAEPCYPVDPEIHVVEDAVFHTQRAAHVSLVAQDYGALYSLYTEIIGLTPVAGGPDHDFVLLGGSEGYQDLSLFRQQPGWESGFHHGGYELADDAAFERSLKLLAERGIEVERQIDSPARRAVHIKDPSGNRLQFFTNGAQPLSTLADLPAADALFLG